jgi:hypothetical protein
MAFAWVNDLSSFRADPDPTRTKNLKSRSGKPGLECSKPEKIHAVVFDF